MDTITSIEAFRRVIESGSFRRPRGA